MNFNEKFDIVYHLKSSLEEQEAAELSKLKKVYEQLTVASTLCGLGAVALVNVTSKNLRKQPFLVKLLMLVPTYFITVTSVMYYPKKETEKFNDYIINKHKHEILSMEFDSDVANKLQFIKEHYEKIGDEKA